MKNNDKTLPSVDQIDSTLYKAVKAYSEKLDEGHFMPNQYELIKCFINKIYDHSLIDKTQLFLLEEQVDVISDLGGE